MAFLKNLSKLAQCAIAHLNESLGLVNRKTTPQFQGGKLEAHLKWLENGGNGGFPDFPIFNQIGALVIVFSVSL